MIRIPTYKEHLNGKKIYDQYMLLIALILPFPWEVILDNDVLHVNGIEITAENFLEKTGKRPRNRNKGYLQLLKKYGFPSGSSRRTREERFNEDQLLAAKIIKRTIPALYKFLYKSKRLSAIAPEMNKNNLRELLLTKMDEIGANLNAIPIFNSKRKTDLKDLKEVFRYDVFADHPYAVKLMYEMDIRVCPYCNRQYTVTVSTAKDKKLIRPQFDHYRSKIHYPYFAVSLLNLIPCCSYCNQKKADTMLEVLYPYSDEMGTKIVFRIKENGDLRYFLGDKDAINNLKIELVQIDKSLSNETVNKFKCSNDIFCLNELYNTHTDYVLCLLMKKYIYNQEYLQFLYSQFGDIFHSMADVKRVAYLMDIDPQQWGRRPLSKLTHDIDAEIEGLMDDSMI